MKLLCVAIEVLIISIIAGFVIYAAMNQFPIVSMVLLLLAMFLLSLYIAHLLVDETETETEAETDC